MIELSNKFYVYEHWRTDRDECFYVGKGMGRRAYDLKKSRNNYHKAVISKVIREGFAVEIKIVASSLSEEEAFTLEVQRIAFWRAANIELVNLTDGGEGVSGLKHNEETRRKLSENNGSKSPEARKKMSDSAKKRKASEETKKKISNASKGRFHTAETRLRMSKSQMGNQHWLGRSLTEEHKRKISEAQKGKPKPSPSLEARQKMSKAHKGHKYNLGRKHTEETRKKLSEIRIGRKLSDETKRKISEARKKRSTKSII